MARGREVELARGMREEMARIMEGVEGGEEHEFRFSEDDAMSEDYDDNPYYWPHRPPIHANLSNTNVRREAAALTDA